MRKRQVFLFRKKPCVLKSCMHVRFKRLRVTAECPWVRAIAKLASHQSWRRTRTSGGAFIYWGKTRLRGRLKHDQICCFSAADQECLETVSTTNLVGGSTSLTFLLLIKHFLIAAHFDRIL